MNKQKALERLREIEKEINIWYNLSECRKVKSCHEYLEYQELLKEAQKIKDDWVDDCGKKFVKDNCYNTYCGEEWNCPTCEKQNKEEKEICGRILG